MPSATVPVKAKLDFSQITSALWKAIEEGYPPAIEGGGWPYLVAVYDNFLIAKIRVGKTYDLHRVDYKVNADDSIELQGEPQAVEEKFVYKGTMKMVASAFVEGDEAQKLLDELIEKNPLFASLKDSPNTHLVVFDLTSVGKPSNHAGKIKFQLAKAGLEDALPTLISKPIHITEKYDGHFEAGKAPKPIGAFLGAVGIEQPDGSIVVRAVGTLWDEDFPDETATIRSNKSKLGASYELRYLPLHASRVSDSLIEIEKWEFSGGAILRKDAAAHPETQVLVAQDLDALNKGVEKTQDRRVIRKEASMAKYQGVPAEFESAVDAAIQAAVAAAMSETAQAKKFSDLEASVAAATKEVETLKASVVEKDKEIEALKASVTEKEKAVADAAQKIDEVGKAKEAVEAARLEAQSKLEEIELTQKADAEWVKLSAKHGWADDQKEKKIVTIRKMVAGKEPVSIEEMSALLEGTKGAQKKVPLFAGASGGSKEVDVEKVKGNFPTLATRLGGK